MADIGTKALSESNFEKLRDIINGNSWEDNQRKHSETNYSFLMFNVTDKGYESEGGESKEAMGSEQSHGQSVIEITSSAEEFSSVGNESSSITDEAVSDRHPEGTITPTIQEETYGARRNLVGQRPLRESHKSQSQSLPRIPPQTWDLFIEDPTPYVGHPQFIQISPRGFYDAVKEWPWSPHIGHLPPKDGLKIDFIALNDL